MWFIDSLVNGNLKELRAFARGLVERDVKISWLGYARCDGRMDIEYLQDLKAGGCSVLNLGIESGSQKVLDLMKKNVKLEHVEQNLFDMTTVGIQAHSNWFVGFPGEQPVDMAHTMTLLWRTRNTSLNGWSFTVCNVNPDTPLHNEREKFGMSHGHYAAHWVTEDYTNTIVHRLVRYKTVNILLNHLRRPRMERPGVENHYTLTYDTKKVSIDKLKPNPDNPRIIKDDKFKKLVQSIKDFPEMLKLRPIVVDKDMVVLGGNMRLRALKDAGVKEVEVIIANNLTDDQKREFIIKDNVGFGEWNWETLANEWDSDKLDEWGLVINNFNTDDIDLDAFFEEDNTDKEQKFKIILEYTQDDYNAVQEALKSYSGSKEQIFYKLLGL